MVGEGQKDMCSNEGRWMGRKECQVVGSGQVMESSG